MKGSDPLDGGLKWGRRRFLNLAAAGAGTATFLNHCRSTRSPSVLRSSMGFELEEATVTQLQETMRSGRFSSGSITQIYLDRIRELDRRGPALRSIIEVNPDAVDRVGSVQGRSHRYTWIGFASWTVEGPR